ncbi:glycosyl transferase [Cylindrospermum stagnale PCC 7417]|uniref:Glycosyl transferase n=1 Tax=Cylindrospermum stagnale PCC 7417 TaxID=56107 RepID=K9WSE9_9NOST|nr:glycosyltransferase family A protein [Cylindrospermum stagnale]AFZ22701.1 glycosyl transferase [Cylindrospermum stagnale PCC 7417]
MNITVSIVIPAYNSSRYLAETIEHVLSQTFFDYEVLIINDGSTDNTAEIATYYSQQDSRVKLFTQNNQGLSGARNAGIQIAQGEYIAFLDSDDHWLPHKLAAHMEHFARCPDLGLSFGRIEFMSFDGKPTRKFSNSRLFKLTPKHFYYENPVITPSNAVIRRSVLGQIGLFDRSLKVWEDMDLFLRAASKGWKVEGINQVLVRYRNNQAGLSSNLYLMEENWQQFSNRVQQYEPELVNQHYHTAKAASLCYLARRSLRLGQSSEIGVDLINRALKSDWKIILREPRRTILTIMALYVNYLIPGLIIAN